MKGAWGEKAARLYLEKRGWHTAATNFRTRFGEIDIIAENAQYVIFAEVKTRRNARYGPACEAVTPAKQAKIMAAEAEAASILKVQQAMADSMRLLNENAPNDQVIKLKALEALEKVADGKATKLIIPSEIQGLAGLAASAKMLVENDAPAAE